MKRIINILSIGILLLAGCQGMQELDTNQYSDNAVKLVSFGPNPVMRGATLSFYGSNLDKVTKVEVPGVDAITSIEVVKSGNPSEIRVQLPADGTTIGVVTLTASDGTVLTTQSELTYTEPIIFTSLSPTSVMPGDVITIQGDYMNLVTEVIFEDEVSVPVNEGATRYELTVTVPANAITGEPILTDGANLIYSFTNVTVGDPTVTGLNAAEPKPGKDVVIAGKYLSMIQSVTFEGDVKLDTSKFTVNADATSLTVAIPAEAKSGDVVLTSYAGKDFTSGSVTMTKPSALSVSPTPVKAGNALVISGKDLDVVTAVNFSGANGAEFSFADNKITVTGVPATAKEGDIDLVMANGEGSKVAFTLVHPTVTSITPTTITAGDVIKVAGTDLDLITGVTLGGKDEEFTTKIDTVTITTAATSVAGKIILKLANGETVEPTEDITVNYDSFIVVNEMPASEHIGATVTLKGTNFMMVDRIYIGETKVTQYLKRTDDEISFVMPYNKVGTYSITFELLSGDKEVCPTQIEVLLEINRIIAWEGKTQITWGDGGRVLVPASKFLGVTPGTVMRLYYTQVDQQWDQAQFNYGDWSGINFNGTGGTTFNQNLVPTDVYGWFADGILDRCTEVVLTKEILDNIEAKKGDAEGQSELGIIIQGSGLTFTLIEILQEIPQERTLWEGSVQITWGDGGRVLIPASKFEGLAAGAEMSLYYTQVDQQWDQAQFNYGDWSGINFNGTGGTTFNQNLVPTDVYGWFTDGILDRCTKVILTQEILDNIEAKKGSAEGQDNLGIIIQGSGLTFTKIVAL